MDTTISPPPPNSNDLTPCENFLKNRKFQSKIIFTGQKRGWSFARKSPPKLKWGRLLRKYSFEFGGGEIVVSNTVIFVSMENFKAITIDNIQWFRSHNVNFLLAEYIKGNCFFIPPPEKKKHQKKKGIFFSQNPIF